MRFFRNKLLIIISVLSALLLATIIFTATGRTRPTPIEGVIGGVISPVQRVFYATGDFFERTFGNLFNIRNVMKENEQIKVELIKLQEQNRQFYQLAIENQQLRSILQFKNNNPQYSYIGANITGKDPGNWFDTFTINKGTVDGAQVNDAIVTGEGLVGRIIEAGDSYSKVLSIIDERSSVSILVNRTRDIGIVSGTTNSDLVAIMPLEADIVKGDEIISSDFSTFPKGLFIGKVKSVTKEEFKLHKMVLIEPSVDFKRLEQVFLIRNIKTQE